MTGTPDCAQVRDLAPELALGVASGGARASALTHLGWCGACRAHVAELSDVADSVLQLAPEAEPPAGFETRVLGKLVAVPGHRRWARAALAVAAALGLLVGSVAGWALFRDRDSRLERAYVEALERLGGRALAAGTLEDGDGRDVGRVFVYLGDITWVFVAVEDQRASDGVYAIEVRRADGPPLVVPGLTVAGGRGSLGGTIDLRSLRDVRGLALVDTAGQRPYVGAFDFD